MPIYISSARVDWGWSQRSEPERAIIRRQQAQLGEGDHGLESFSEQLADASTELPSLEIRALVFDETRSRTLLLARAGVVTRIHIKDVLAPLPAKDGPGFVRWSALRQAPLDEDPTIQCGSAAAAVDTALAAAVDGSQPSQPENGEVEVPYEYASEEAMRSALTIAARAMTGEPVELIAEVPSQAARRFWVTLRPGRAEIRSTRSWPSSDLHEHAQLIESLLAASPSELVPEAATVRERAAGRDKLEQPLYFSEAMLQEIQEQATRCDRSLSWIAQSAWRFAQPRIAELADRAAASASLRPLSDSPKRKQTLYFSTDMLIEMEAEAARFDSSLSWVVQLACTLAREQLVALPSAES